MIKASELRIGNIFRGIGGIQTVLSLEENTDRGRCNYSSEEHRLMYSHLILCHQNGNQYKPFEIEPIPLTEEILLKVGFINEFSNSWSDNVFQLFENKGNVAGSEIGEFYCSTGQRYVCSFKYLHQLQNLYFALTCQELNTAGLI